MKPPSSIALPTAPFHPMRNSYGDIVTPGSASHFDLANFPRLSPGSESATHAATMRWAGARVNIAPFPLPSPEHEYTDPMRGYTTTIPRSHSQKSNTNNMGSVDTLFHQNRKSRLDEFWKGTQDIEPPTADVIPEAEPPTENHADHRELAPALDIVAASAPLARGLPSNKTQDYFSEHNSPKSPASEDVVPAIGSSLHRRTSTPLSVGVHTVPALPRKVSLARQYSSPLPHSPVILRPLHKGRNADGTSSSLQNSRAAKEEQMYKELGYLAPPNAPDEWERRRALNKCGSPFLRFVSPLIMC